MVKTLKRKRPNTPSNSGTVPASGDSAITIIEAATADHDLLGPADDVSNARATPQQGLVELQTSTSTEGVDQPTPSAEVPKVKVPIFKDPRFVHSSKSGQASKKSRVWKSLKQIITAEKAQCTGPNDVTYATIDAPSSLFPAKKYSDISGLLAKYTDPQTKLRYASVEEFARIRMLPADVVAAYLAVRKANLPVS